MTDCDVANDRAECCCLRPGLKIHLSHQQIEMNLSYIVTLAFYFGIALHFVGAYSPNTCIRCQNTNRCKPPKCVCCSDDMPLPYKEIPQMVFFTFDDAITPQVAGFYRQLFYSSRRNPNGCPVSMTLFISHSNTVYSLVREFYQKGMEIASHSVSHGHPKASTFKDEANKQKQNLARMARIPHTRIKGWRSPFLEPLGDAQPNMLQELGYSYDATLTISKKTLDEKPPVPFTLDYGWPYDCKIKPCPKQRHRGFWEVPVISLMDYLQRFDCVYVDGCNNPPPDEEAAFRFLWDNFQSYYKTNRAPFGINMHASWFFYPDRLKAMDRFIRELVLLDDVYIVSVKQVIDWLRNPVRLHDIKSFEPWGCNNGNKSTTSTKSAFDLRNQKIEQRLKELRRQRFEKQEIDFLQNHRTWEMQQAAKKAGKYSRYANSRRPMPLGPSTTMYSKQLRPNVSPSRTSSAMTWQQMLMAHARKQHVNSRKIQRPSYSKSRMSTAVNLNTKHVNQLDNRRMVRPVNKNSNPRQKQIMLKERKRIREQQRIAAQNRLKEAKRLEKKGLITKNDKMKHPVNKQRQQNTKPVLQKMELRQINKVSHHNQRTPKHTQRNSRPTQHQPRPTHNNIKPLKRNFTPVHGISRPRQTKHKSTNSTQGIHKKSTIVFLQSKNKRMNSNSPITSFRYSPKPRVSSKTKMLQLKPHSQNTVYKHLTTQRQIKRRQNIRQVPVLRKPKMIETIQKPVQRRRIQPNTLALRKQNIRGKQKLHIKDRIEYNKTRSGSRKKAPMSKLKLVGRSWNLFNMKPSEMKFPWQKWILGDVKEQIAEILKLNVTNNHKGVVKRKKSNDLSKAKVRTKALHTLKKNETKNSDILPLTRTLGIEQNTSNPIILSARNKTVVEQTVKLDVKLSEKEHILSKSVSNGNKCRQEVNCFSPKCFCMTNKNPFNMKTNDIPQIVYVTIEGDINFLSYSKMRSLFKAQRINPNGCPIGSTFFISEQGTSYSLARNLQRYGTEIAMNGVQKKGYMNIESMKIDIDRQIKNIAKRIVNTHKSLIGWRSPDLKVLGDDQFELFENKSIYDASLVLDRSMKVWPFTLDYGLTKHCKDMTTCNIHKHPGIFEVPIIPLFGYNKSEPCDYADTCFNQPKSSEDTFQYLLKNFEKYYYGNRAPFGLHLTQKWFHWSFNKNLAGLSKFFDRLLEYNDVYMVNISDMLKWVKNPTKISEISNSEIWNC